MANSKMIRNIVLPNTPDLGVDLHIIYTEYDSRRAILDIDFSFNNPNQLSDTQVYDEDIIVDLDASGGLCHLEMLAPPGVDTPEFMEYLDGAGLTVVQCATIAAEVYATNGARYLPTPSWLRPGAGNRSSWTKLEDAE